MQAIFAIVLVVAAVANAGLVYNSPVVAYHSAPVVHAVPTQVITPVAHSTSYKIRAPSAKVLTLRSPIAVHSAPAYHSLPLVHTAHHGVLVH